MSTGKRAGTFVLLVVAWGVNLAFDGIGGLVPALAPPHLLHRFMPEAVRGMVSPAVLAPMASVVLAGIAVLLLSIVPPSAPRRLLVLTGWLFGFWLLSEGLLAWVWLDGPALPILAAIATGVPRSLALAWVLLRVRGPAPGAAG